MKHRVLLVDDDASIRAAYRSMLTGHMPGLRIEEAGGAVEAIRLLKKERYDCVFLDYMMDDGTGLAVLTEVQPFNKSPIVMLTGRVEAQLAVSALRAGAVDYLVKDTLRAENLVAGVQTAVMHRLRLKSREQNLRRLALVHTLLLQSAELILIVDLSAQRLIEASNVGLARIGVRRADVLDKDVRELRLFGPQGWDVFAQAVMQGPTPLPTATPGLTLQARAQMQVVDGTSYLVILAQTVPAS
jgi:CheY-like chemotaxis protein